MDAGSTQNDIALLIGQAFLQGVKSAHNEPRQEDPVDISEIDVVRNRDALMWALNQLAPYSTPEERFRMLVRMQTLPEGTFAPECKGLIDEAIELLREEVEDAPMLEIIWNRAQEMFVRSPVFMSLAVLAIAWLFVDGALSMLRLLKVW